MEENLDQASITTDRAALHLFSDENNDIEILHNGKNINDFIDSKIKYLVSMDNEEPFFVANLDSVFNSHLRWITNLPRVKPFYAVKCNNTPVVIKLLSALGTGFDCASKGEIQLAMSLGVTPDKIIYANTTKPPSHIRYARTHGVDMMTFDNEDELLKISLCHAKAKLVLRIAVDDSKSLGKLNSKFGARLSSAGKLLQCAAELGLQVIGVSFHVGTGCTASDAFKLAIADGRRVFDIAKTVGFQMSLLDIGGGFSATDDAQVKFEEFSEGINESLDEFFPPESGVEIIAEPGRYFVESAFTLAVNVTAKRVIFNGMNENCSEVENCPDGTMMYYINDGVHGSLGFLSIDPAHSCVEPYLHRAVESSEPKYLSVIWGPTCDSGDKVTDNYWMPELHVGDWLLIDNVGAYSVSLCTDFNGFERARIYPVVTTETCKTLINCHL